MGKITLEEAKKKYKSSIIKNQGFLDSDSTQLIFFSELSGGKDQINRTKRNLYIIREEIYYLPDALKQKLLRFIDFDEELPVDIKYVQGSERFKIPLKYFNEMTPTFTEEPIEIQKKDNSIITNITSQPCANQLLDHFNNFIKDPQKNVTSFIIEIAKYSSLQ